MLGRRPGTAAEEPCRGQEGMPGRWLAALAIGLGSFLTQFDFSLNISLPSISEALRADLLAVQWVIIVYLLTISGLLVAFGRLADIWGGRSTLVSKEVTMVSVYKERLKRLGHLMEHEGLDALLLAKPANLFYLTGDGRLCAYAMVTQDGKVALGVPKTDLEDVKALAHYDHIVGFEDEVEMLHSINHFFHELGLERAKVGLEYTFLTKSMFAMFTHPHAIPQTATVVDGTHALSELRMVKGQEEIELIRAAAKVAEAGMAAALKALRAGITEIEIAGEAEYAMRRAGAEGFYRTYVASGPRTNIAHGLPSYRALQEGDLVMIDLHPVCHGYSADMCRTASVGRPSAKQKAACDLFLRAQQEAVAKVKAGVTMHELEEAIHGPLRDAGYGEGIFGPPLHGVGIEFEEPPLPSGHAFFHGEAEAPPLAAGVVLAVGNCGLYMGPFGVRVEDTVLVAQAGPEALTNYPRALL